ncbi:MAG: metalloregulator ArsR/SmtB family transcription factor [Candidatus Obscuribacterales bacterium]|nr:metalloregulator ArsR/SmtB family transcription factor [Candidatus Obscuribacterales bacterium]
MPYRTLVTKELAELFGVLSHPHRIQIVEELHGGEKDVNSLVEILQISQSGVSQHLSQLRLHKLVVERKQGRSVFYHLRDKDIATWALEGLKFIGPQKEEVQEFFSAVEKARSYWSDDLTESG